MKVGELYALLGLDTTQFESGMAKSKASFAGFGSVLGGMSTLIGLGLVTSVVGGLVASTKAAADFQAKMEMVRTQAGASQAEVDSMSRSLLNLAGPLGSSPDELANALYHMESAGFRGAEALSMVEAAAKLAKVGNADFDSSAQAVVATMAAYGDSGLKAADAVGILNAIVGAGDMRMQQLTDAMGTGILASAKTFGLSLTDVGAALATLTDNAIPADQAATNLRHTLSMMGAPSGPAQKAFNALGLSATQLADDMRKPNGLLLALEDLKGHLGQIDTSNMKGGIDGARADMESFGFTTKQIDDILKTLGPTATEQAVILSHAFGGGKTSGTILTLLAEMDRVKQKYADIGSGASKFGDAWTTTTQTLSFRWNAFKDEISADAIKIGDLLLPDVSAAFAGLTAGIHNLVQAISSGSNPTLRSLVKIVQEVGAEIMSHKGQIEALASSYMHLLQPSIQVLAHHTGDLKVVLEATAIVLAGLIVITASAIAVEVKFAAILVMAKDAVFNLTNAMLGGLQSAIIATVLGFRAADSATGGFLGSVLSTVGAILSSVVTLPFRIAGALSGLFSIGWEAGSALMQGLLNGITGGFWTEVQAFIGGVAPWIADHKGPISRDRQLLVPHGQAIMAGLKHGLTAGFGDVQNLVGGMGANIGGPRISGSVRTGSGAGAQKAAQPIYVEIHQPVMLDGQVIGKIVDRRVQNGIAGAFA